MSAETLHAEIQSPQRRCPCSALLAAGRTKYRSVVLGKDLILGSVWEHIDEVAQVPQSVSQGSYGEISRGERLQVPEVSVRCKRDKLFQACPHERIMVVGLWEGLLKEQSLSQHALQP